MVEHRPWLTFAAHAVLVLGVLFVAFPVYMTFVASTHDQATMLSGPVPLLPGAVPRRELPHRAAQRARRLVELAAGRADDVQQPGDGARHRARQDRDLDHRRLCDRLFQVPVAHDVLLDDLHHADAAGRGTHPADLRGGRGSRPAQQLCRSDHPADRIGDRHVSVPPVLPDGAGRADRGGAHRRCRSAAVLLSTCCCRCRAPRSRRCS